MPANLSGAYFKITGIVLHVAIYYFSCSMRYLHVLSNTILELIDYLIAS